MALVIMLLFRVSMVSAQIQLITGTGRAIFDAGSVVDEQKKIAYGLAKENVVEKTGIYVRSYSKVKNNMIQEDEIIPVSSKIVKVLSTEYVTAVDGNGIYFIEARLLAEVDDQYLDRIRQSDIAAISNEYKRLKEKYDLLDSEDKKIRLQIEAYALYESGNRYIDEKKYTLAIDAFKKSLIVNPDQKAAHIGLGTVYKLSNQMDRALGEYDDILSLDNKYLAAYYGKASTYEYNKEYKKALLNYNIVLTLNDQYMLGYIGRARAYKMLGNRDLAIRDYNMARNLGLMNGE